MKWSRLPEYILPQRRISAMEGGRACGRKPDLNAPRSLPWQSSPLVVIFSTTSAATVASTLAASSLVHAAGSDLLRVGLIGCGGRGTGAATQALAADPTSSSSPWPTPSRTGSRTAWSTLQKSEKIAAKVDVKPEHRFVGFDAYQQADRQRGRCRVALHAAAIPAACICKRAIEAGKHVFAEKPVAVDAPGVRSVLESCELGQDEGAVGRLRALPPLRQRLPRTRAAASTTAPSARSATASGQRLPQRPLGQAAAAGLDRHACTRCANWYNFTWLSGDFNVEQHVHFLDVCAWVMKDEYPVKAVGMGGRQVLTGAEYGQIYDHFSVVYEYADGPGSSATAGSSRGARTT